MVGEPQNEPDGNLFYEFTNGSFSGNIIILGQSGAFDGTTYVYRGTNTPQAAITYSCGHRRVWLWAHQSRGNDELSTSY